jgi:hypothetical protein
MRLCLYPAALFVVGMLSGLHNASFAAVKPIEDAEINIPTTLPFGEQLQLHANLLQRLSEVALEIDKDKNAAKSQNSLPKYLEAEESYKNVQRVLAPYGIARAKANFLIDQGYRLRAIEPQVCKGAGNECTAVDPITAVFFFDRQLGLSPELADKTKTATSGAEPTVSVNGFNLTAFVKFLSNKPLDSATFGILPSVRDAIIPLDNTGEIAMWIRDPGKRTAEIVQNVRDGALKAVGLGGENNDLGKALKDPINCTVGKLFGRCN